MEFKKKQGTKWKEVLLEIYREEPISFEEHRHSLDYLKKHGLIEQRRKPDLKSPFDRHGNWTHILTKKGFNVAMDVEEQRETSLYRRSSLLFSWIVVLTLLETLFHQMNIVDPEYILGSYIFAVPTAAALLLLLGIYPKKWTFLIIGLSLAAFLLILKFY